MSDSNYGLYGGIGSLIIAALGILGFGKRLDTLAKTKMDITQFNEFKDAQRKDHDRMEKHFERVFDKLEQVYDRMPKRKANGEWSGE